MLHKSCARFTQLLALEYVFSDYRREFFLNFEISDTPTHISLTAKVFPADVY